MSHILTFLIKIQFSFFNRLLSKRYYIVYTPLSIFLFSSIILSAQTLPIFKTYNQVNNVSAIAEFNNGANYLMNACTGDKATYLWTDGQGNLLNVESDYPGSCLQYNVDGAMYIKADTVGVAPNRDIRFRKIRRDGSLILEKTYPLSLDNYGQFAMPSTEGGFLLGGVTHVANDSLPKIQLIKTDIDGNIEWQKVLNQNLVYSRTRTCNGLVFSKNFTISMMGQTTDQGYFIVYDVSDRAGTCNQGNNTTQYLVRIDKNGNYLWQKGILRFGDYSYRIRPAENGTLLVIENISDVNPNGCAGNSYNLLKINTSGDTLWTFLRKGFTCMAAGLQQFAGGITITRSGDVMLASTANGTTGTILRRINNTTGQQLDSVIVLKENSPSLLPTRMIEARDSALVMVGAMPNSIFFYKFRYPTLTPDLTLENLNIATPSVQQGQVLSFRVDIKNIGTSAVTGEFTVKSYISRDNILSADDVQDGTIRTGNYNAGFSVPQVIGAATISSTLATGQYYLIVKVDADNQVSESNENNNTIVSVSPFSVTPISTNTNCLNVFRLEGFDNKNQCLRTGATNPSNFGNLYQYGQNITAGFMLRIGNASNVANLFAKNGTTNRPASARFSNCTGNWVYFTAEGGSIRNDARSSTVEYPQVFLRVRTFGANNTIDSLYIEIDSNTLELPLSMASVVKSQNCNACYANDRTAPSFSNCPSDMITYPLESPQTPFFTSTVLQKLNIISIDDCLIRENAPIQYNFPNFVDANWRKVFDYKIVRFDSAGNKGVCAFTARMSNPPCSLFTTVKPVISNCPRNISLRADGLQTCVPVSWGAPTATSGAPIPLSMTSSNQPGFCFPIGTTQVVYTAIDSCGGRTTCDFTVTILASNTPLPDLSLNNLTAPANAVTNQRVDISFDIRNTGQTQVLEPHVIGHYLSKDTILSADDVVCGSLANSTTPIGITSNIKSFITIPSNLTAGTYYLICKIDTANVITEGSETNNTLFKAMAITRSTPTNEITIFNNLKWMPNPTTENLTVQLTSLKDGLYRFDIINTLGQKVKTIQKNIVIGENTFVLETFDLDSGIYMVRSSLTNTPHSVFKFLKF